MIVQTAHQLNVLLQIIWILTRCYLVVSQSCSVSATEQNITASSTHLQVFTSPGYNNGAGSYTSNMDCWWIIDSGSDDLKILIFLTYDTTCPGDKIDIYDGGIDSASTLAFGICGTVSDPVSYSTTQRYARIEMVTDGATENAGFKLEYLASKDYSRIGCTNTQLLTTSDTYQYLSSPNFPALYASSSNCRWNLYNPNGVIDIDVVVGDIEDDDPASCNYDKYQIYDGENKCDHNVVQMICSEYPKTGPYTYTSNGTNLVVSFISDSSVNRRGFLLRYKGVNKYSSSSTELASATTTTKTKVTKIDKSSDQMSTELILGIVFGSLVLLCFTIITVVFVVTRVNVPVQRTITPTETIRRSPSIAWSVRSRKPSKNKQSATITQPIFITNETLTSTESIVPNGVPPRATTNNMSLSFV